VTSLLRFVVQLLQLLRLVVMQAGEAAICVIFTT
jgi:hypothetical protein